MKTTRSTPTGLAVTFPHPSRPGAEFSILIGHDAAEKAREVIGTGRGNRWPHHTASAPHALLGAVRWSPDEPDGNSMLKLQPGEILMAGCATLVLQDLPEFKRSAIEMIARAWRNGFVRLQARTPWQAQSDMVLELPVHCSIYATAQSCPCSVGPTQTCLCRADALKRWKTRVADAIMLFRGRS